MNNPKTFNLLYYLSFGLTFIIGIIVSFINEKLGIDLLGVFVYPDIESLFSIVIVLLTILLIVINFVLVIINTVFLRKRQSNNVNIMFPAMYLVFTITVSIVAILFNSKLIFPGIHYNYYLCFILFNHLLLNIYSVLSFSKK